MRNGVIQRYALALACVFGLILPAAAQEATPERRPVSVRPGMLNVADDGTQIRREDEPEWETIAARKRARSGDALRTTGEARAELLLTPGSYLRLDKGSEVEFTGDSPGWLHFTLRRGAAILEIVGPEGASCNISVTTPSGSFTILKPGIYRVRVLGKRTSEILMRRGLIVLTNKNWARFEGRRLIYLDTGGFEIGPYLQARTDTFDDWSASRSRQLADANAKLDSPDTRGMTGRPSRPVTVAQTPDFGVWVYSERIESYTFYPYYDNCSSPYGHDYTACEHRHWSPAPPTYVNQETPPPDYGSPAKPPAPVWTPPQPPVEYQPPQPGMYNTENSGANPGSYNTGPVYPEKPAPPNQPLPPDDYRNGPPPQARDKAPGTVPSYEPPPVSGGSNGGSPGGNPGGNPGGANGGGYNTGGQNPAPAPAPSYEAKPAPVQPQQPPPPPQAPAKPAPAPQAPGKSPSKD